MRDHTPVLIEEFNGLFSRDGDDAVPEDHFTACNNIKFTQSGFKTRDGIEPYMPYANVVRIYPFNQSILVLDTNGNIYHSDRPGMTYTPILHLDGMTDFQIIKFFDRVYISPIGGGNSIYVYKYGSSAGARKAAGSPPSSAPSLSIGPAGHTEQGVHVIACCFETDTGFITGTSPGASITVDGTTKITVGLPAGDSSIVAVHVVASKAIDPADFTGNLNGYQFFFVQRFVTSGGGSVDVDFYDAELLSDASHLQDLFTEIPSCHAMTFYHNRVVYAGILGLPQNVGENLSNLYLSDAGEPEAVNQVDGLMVTPKDGLPITGVWVYRDVLYIGKAAKTRASTDSGDVPSTWVVNIIDDGIGPTNANVISVVMDVGATNIEAALIGHTSGLFIFNGTYQKPEITWKIRDIWKDVRETHIDTFRNMIYVVFDDGTMVMGNFENGLNHQAIRWTPWSFDINIKTACILIEDPSGTRIVGTLLLGSQAFNP